MAKRSISELDFGIRAADGELELTGFNEDDVFEEEEEFDEELPEEELPEEEEVEDKTPDLAMRVDGIERTLQSLPQMISNSILAAMSKAAGKKEEEEEEIPDELDSKQMVNILGKRMEKAVDKRINSIMEENEPALRQARLTKEFQDAASEYGDKFTNVMIPVARLINRVEKNGGKITAKDAYLSLLESGVIGKTASKTQGKSRPAVKVDADSRDSVGNVNENNPRPRFDSKKMKETTDADMFQQAFNGALLTSVRDARRRRA